MMTPRDVAAVRAIQASVAEVFCIPLALLMARVRRPEVAVPRQIAMYLAYSETSRSLPELGVLFERDHTTVLHALKAVGARIKRDPGFAELVRNVSVLLWRAA